MKEKLIDLFEYTHHFNAEMIKVISENRKLIDDKTISLINHTLNAQQIWNARILGESTFEVWQINPLESLQEIDHKNFLKSVDIISNLDLDKRIEYQNSRGTKFENSIFEMLFHAVNHSTYHRGQINSLLKQNGLAPILTDYIFYKR
ncbi:damage-inducible protein DinB [Chryseobacterium indologenes]|uniref:DinB family protein n=1 Tax=Chryseobacterium indologenes TaxID=253 RepID=UPI000BFCC3B5|nr:DinB family protein [Chryseobacterium indologenes]ATN05452.1 damage-inducible protein DinB [Chryseobacterium indologenes]AYY85788.1 damage-inducible protein DinB [Chryseobacterium indologenes]QIX82689.1 damage-inducible protein DinB [Chryseobacterium indologenes]TLX26764.1 damage-inducible protein DinB [Chryseobacterium indologenes]UDQ52345.1 damage-inducible protein DinB [Chryseobacterium indologenes]